MSSAANTAGSLVLFVGAFIIAGIMIAYGESGSRVIQNTFNRLTGKERGLQLKNLSTATVRSVACGVIGVFIGAVLLAISYQVSMEWVNCKDDGDGAGMAQAESAGQD